MHADMHKIPVNQTDSIQAYRLLQEAAEVLGMNDDLFPPVEIVYEHDRFKYSEHELKHLITRKFDKIKLKLFEKNCFGATTDDRAAREDLALEFIKKGDTNYRDRDGGEGGDDEVGGDGGDVGGEIGNMDDDVSSDSEDEDEDEDAAPKDKDASPEDEATSPNESSQDAEADKTSESVPAKRSRSDSMSPLSSKKQKLSAEALKQEMRKLLLAKHEDFVKLVHRKAGQIQRMHAGRRQLRQCQAKFERDVKPQLMALLPPGESWA